MTKSLFVLITLLLISSCNNSSYDKFADCLTKLKESKLEESHLQMCFTKYSKKEKTSEFLAGSGSNKIIEWGDARFYTFFNQGKKILRVDNVELSMDYKEIDKNFIPVIKLTCEQKVLYPRKEIKVKCYNYNDVDSKDYKDYLSMSKSSDVKLFWRIGDLYSISYDNKKLKF